MNSSQLKPLNRLAQALLDLDQGTVADLLKPTKRIGRPPHPYEYELLKALAVAAVDLLMEGGKTEREATVHVARRLTDMGYTVSKRPDADQAVAVQNWRKNIDLNRVKGRRDNILHKLNQVAGDHQAKAEKLLSQLPGIVAVRKR